MCLCPKSRKVYYIRVQQGVIQLSLMIVLRVATEIWNLNIGHKVLIWTEGKNNQILRKNNRTELAN